MTKHALEIYIDAEWDSNNTFICLQFLLVGGDLGLQKYMVFHSKYRSFLEAKGYIEGCVLRNRFNLSFSDFQDDEDILSEIVCTYLQSQNAVNEVISTKADLFMFFSPKDLWGAIGFNQFYPLANPTFDDENCKIHQKRNLSGSFTRSLKSKYEIDSRIRDLCNWTNSGLAELAQSVGLNVSNKHLKDPYNSCMEVGLHAYPHEFVRYSLNDVELLFYVVRKFVSLINWVVQDVFKINHKFFISNVPMTQGRLVARVMELFILNSVESKDSDDLLTKLPVDFPKKLFLYAALAKIGILDQSHPKHSSFLEARKDVFEHKDFSFYTSQEGLTLLKNNVKSFFRGYLYRKYSHASIDYFLRFFSKKC